MAATYSRASYTSTTIGNAAFDGRVRNGNGSDHCFRATTKNTETGGMTSEWFPENYTQDRDHFNSPRKTRNLPGGKLRSSLTPD